uniref:Epiplakin-like n=1 Tax=Nothobranchius furzeri TaxID=105023 RepID=A0A8C6LCI6_NOTFU
MSNTRTQQLKDLQQILQDISSEIMWVNEREEEELMFDWGDKNVDSYIPKKQEGYSKLMSDLEVKEQHLYKLKLRVDELLSTNHPASDKIEAYRDTLQTQWLWILQITKCIDTHLKENAAYSQFFKEANGTFKALQQEHQKLRDTFKCDKDTSLEELTEILKGLESERERLMDFKRQVQHVVSKSKSIVRLKPRNPEEKGSSGTIVRALCDFQQEQKVICKDNEAILKDNSQRSKWLIIGPGGLDMIVPSVCLIVPPPNPLSISLANKNEQFYEAFLNLWNQLYINVKSLMAWNYCLQDIKYIRSLTISMLSEMRPEEYRQIIKNLESHYEDFKATSHETNLFAEEDKMIIENQFVEAQNHYDKLVVELPTYSQYIKAIILILTNTLWLSSACSLFFFVLYRVFHLFIRLRALRDMLENIARAEDIVKVHEARLTEKETTSLSPAEVSEYMATLKSIKAELDQKKDIFTAMEAALTKANYWNSQVGSSSHRCDLMQSRNTEQVGMLSDRWRRIHDQIDTRLQDLQVYMPQLQHYKQTSFLLGLLLLLLHLLSAYPCSITDASSVALFKALNSEIKAKRETIESVLRDNEACVNTIKDYETDLASYTSGLETLLNIPIKRTMLKSPSMDLNQEVIQLQTRYMELLTLSGDHYKFLGQLLKNLEELKMRNTQIDLLQEELRQLKDEMKDRNSKNKSLEDAVARYQLELSQFKDQVLSLEEVKRTTVLQCSVTKDSLDSTQSKVAELNDEVERLKYQLSEEKRKTKLAEERYVQQQEEYDLVLKKRQKELETVSWSKVEVEKSVTIKEREIELLRRQLAEESAKVMELQKDMSKVRSQICTNINKLKLGYEYQIQLSRTEIETLEAQRADVTAQLQLQYDRMEADRRDLEEELRRLRISVSQAEEEKERAEYETCRQRATLMEEGCKRREMESRVELLMRQKDEERNQYREELAEVMNTLQEKSDQLVYVTHSLQEETRRRKTTEEGQAVLEQSLVELQLKITNSSVATTQLRECDQELQQTRLELERENKERYRVEQKLSRLQGRIKDLQAVRDGLESQVENLRKAHQEEVSKRMQVEVELEKTTLTVAEYISTISELRQSHEQTCTSEKRGEEERLRLKEDLEKTLRQNQSSAELKTQLSDELKSLKQQLLQEEVRVKDANLRNEDLNKTIEEKNEIINENFVELQRLKEMIETQTKERMRLDEELRSARQAKEELLKSKKGMDDELSSQITALELQLQASERSNLDHSNLVSEFSSEREKLKLEAEKMLKQRLEMDKEQSQRLEEELSRIRLSFDSELRNRQRLQEENDRMKRDLSYWKEQCDGKQSMTRQYDTEKNIVERETYQSRLVTQTVGTELKSTREPPPPDTSSLVFDGVRKPVTAKQLVDCGVLDPPTFSLLVKGHKTVPEVASDKKVSLKGTGPIAGVIIEGSKAPGSRKRGKMSLTDAKKKMLLPEESADLLLEAQAATGHIIDPKANKKFTVEEACARSVIDINDLDRLMAAEAAAVGYKDPTAAKPISVFKAIKKGMIDEETGIRLLQAQESVGGILDPNLSVFLPKDTAIKRNLIDRNLCQALKQNPACYIEPETEQNVSYEALKEKCKIEPHTGLLLLPITDKLDPSDLIFDGVRKPVTAKQLLDCGVLDKPTFNKLLKGEKTVPEVSVDKKIPLKGTGPIAGLTVGPLGKMSLTEAKKQMLMSPDSADLLLEAQAATGHIIDPMSNKKLTVEEACTKGVVDKGDKDKLLAAEAAAVGYPDPLTGKNLSVFEAMKKGIIDKKTAVRLLQAQECVGGILDPNLSVFLPKETAIRRNLLDQDLSRALNKNPECFLDPENEDNTSYGTMKKKCKTEPETGLILLQIAERKDPSKLMFDGVRKQVSAKQLLECNVLDKPTFNKLIKGENSVPEVSVDKKVILKGTGPIAGVVAGPLGKMSFSEAKKQMLMPPDSADLLLAAQAATGHIIDPMTNQKLTVEEACARGVVDKVDKDKLLADEAAAVGYKDPQTGKSLSVFEAMKKGLVDKPTAVRLLQAQESTGGILDPNLSVFLPKDTATKRNLLDHDLSRALNQNPDCFLDPDTENNTSYETLKKKCKIEQGTGLILLPIA